MAGKSIQARQERLAAVSESLDGRILGVAS